jgi:hypothetical protein
MGLQQKKAEIALENVMELSLYQDVVLLIDLPDEDLFAGDIGTVVARHDNADCETGYSLEFFDLLGHTLTIVTLPTSALRCPLPGDRPTVRRST